MRSKTRLWAEPRRLALRTDQDSCVGRTVTASAPIGANANGKARIEVRIDVMSLLLPGASHQQPRRQYGQSNCPEAMVIGSLTATVLLVSSQVKGPDREGVFDALVNAAIYTKFCDGALSPNTQKILGGYTGGLAVCDGASFAAWVRDEAPLLAPHNAVSRSTVRTSAAAVNQRVRCQT